MSVVSWLIFLKMKMIMKMKNQKYVGVYGKGFTVDGLHSYFLHSSLWSFFPLDSVLQ